jgi:hypothetical protein
VRMRIFAALAVVLTTHAALAERADPEAAVLQSVSCTLAGTVAAATIALLVLPRTDDASTLVSTSIGSAALGATALVFCPSLGRLLAGMDAGRFIVTRALTLVGGAALVGIIALAGGVYGAIAAGIVVGTATGVGLLVEGIYDIATTPGDVRTALATTGLPRASAFAIHF